MDAAQETAKGTILNALPRKSGAQPIDMAQRR
jgi:hypothetical protein